MQCLDTQGNATFPGDELVPAPASFVNRAVTINASPEQIYPWLLQMGAGKGGLYSYTSFENMIGCKLVNANRIHEEWQNLEDGEWVDLWQFILVPQADNSTRLILRTRTMMVGGFWDIIHSGVFIMERGLLLGVKERAER